MPKLRHFSQLQVARYPVRTCQTLHECGVCGQAIRLGERYRDGGYSRRICMTCAPESAEAEGPKEE